MEHRVAETRSIELHREIARRVERDPSLLDAVRLRVEGWLQSGDVHPVYATKWRDALARPLPELLALLVDPSESARALRQCTPFTGILDSATRWEIWRRAGAKADEQATR